jgi:hypothetical protein
MARCGKVGFGVVQQGMAGMARLGMAWQGDAGILFLTRRKL